MRHIISYVLIILILMSGPGPLVVKVDASPIGQFGKRFAKYFDDLIKQGKNIKSPVSPQDFIDIILEDGVRHVYNKATNERNKRCCLIANRYLIECYTCIKRKKIAALRENLMVQVNSLDKVVARVSKQKEALIQAQEQLQSVTDTVNSLNEQAQEIELEIAALREKIGKNLKAQINSLDEADTRVSKQKEALIQAQEQLQSVTDTVNSLNEQAQEIELEIAVLRELREKIGKNLNSLDEADTRVFKQNEALIQAAIDMVNSLNEQAQEIELEIAVLRELREKIGKNLKAQTNSLDEIATRVSELETELKDINNSLKDADTPVSDPETKAEKKN